jgi:iron(II)-dependent oxidoreductase
MPANTSSSRSTTSTISEQQAFTAVFNNNDWTTIERDFNGVTMVLVPVGCFTMGHNEGLDNEKPEHEQCFDQPFWIDKYEVTNRQFQNNGGYAGRGSYWSGADYPRDSITWIESRDYCASRGARLPTEREWEYAARGPSNLLYPWGNQYDSNRVVDGDTSGGTTKSVGSRPSGQSWIGAMDMAGNLYEWTSSKYVPASGSWIYPYSPTDGREEDNDTVTTRVMRGGAWAYTDTWNASTRREVHDTTYQSYGIGLRCVKDY